MYLIVADEYAGTEELNQVFHFDNSPFENDLEKRGFHIVKKPRSNYNFTPFSIASTLNFSYLPLKDTNHTAAELAKVMGLIAGNNITHFFYNQGYQVFNNSIFDLPREPKQVVSTFLPNKTKYITAQTLLSRLDRDLYYHLVTSLKWEWAIKRGLYANANSNKVLLAKTIATSKRRGKPKFSYTHLSMPHWPFYVNENGTPYPYQQLLDDGNKEHYISYLQYSNKVLLHLIDQILQNSKQPPIIVFISDHGFRLSGNGNERDYNFMNICAIYTPSKKYASYYDGLSLVNLFRVVLNTEFGQQLPLIKDATLFLKD
ncbi:MAG TPA: sulfatase-like hydrolase/transferase [Chitinophagaceae bacterium]|nr:sulfatase-like hydrolase/transferase [Chitinophagaceae bacterium]